MTRRGFLFTGGAALGAMDVGVVHALSDKGIRFDLVAGQGSGAVNAAALAGGVDPHQLGQIWLQQAAPRPGWLYERLLPWNLLWRGGGVYTPRRDLWRLLRWRSLLRLSPLREALERHVSEEAVRQSKTRLVLLAWNLDTSELTTFGNDWFLLDQVEASASFPHLFPPVVLERDRFCDPTPLAETSPLAPVALGDHGVDELYFPMPRLRPQPGPHRALRTLSTALLTAWRTGLERDLQVLEALPSGRVPKLIPVEFEAEIPVAGVCDYNMAALHRLLDTGYDRTAESFRAPSPDPSSKKASPPPRKAGPAARKKKPVKRKGTVSRLRKALKKGSGRRRKEPELGF